MSLKHYPKTFVIEEGQFDPDKVYQSERTWKDARGYIPKIPMTWDGNLVQPLFDIYENCPLGYQIRMLNTEVMEEKYQLSKKVYDYLVKTDPENIDGMLIATEGTLDCSLLRSEGFNAVTTLGLKNARLKGAAEELRSTGKFIWMHDNDYAGRASRKFFQNDGQIICVYPQFKDLNEMLMKDPSAYNLFITTLRKIIG